MEKVYKMSERHEMLNERVGVQDKIFSIDLFGNFSFRTSSASIHKNKRVARQPKT
jgi:hypothetical protein